MVNIEELREALQRNLEGTGYFPVEVSENKNGEINVEIDSCNPVDIDFCVELNKKLHEEFGEALDDCDLTVGSAGLTSPFKVLAQYEKNIGNEVEVLTLDGRKLHGTLANVNPQGFTLSMQEKVKKQGMKKPELQQVDEEIKFNNVKYTKYLLQF